MRPTNGSLSSLFVVIGGLRVDKLLLLDFLFADEERFWTDMRTADIQIQKLRI